MNIADDDQNPKREKTLAKSRDAIAALREAMEKRLAEMKGGKSESPSARPERTAAPQPAPDAQQPAPEPPRAERKKTAEPPPEAHKAPDPAEWSRTMFRIAERSQKLIRDFLERNKECPASLEIFDPAHVGEAFMELTNRVLNDPERFASAQLALWQGYAKIWQATLARMQGKPAEPVVTPAPGDKRFRDEAWQNMWLFDFIKQSYLLTARWTQGLVRKESAGLDPKLAHKLDFYTRQMVDAMAPSNFWLTNPEVLRATAASGGENLVKGLENLLEDLERGHGRLSIAMDDPGTFKVGENLAVTPGKVVFQNELMQLIQYAPSTREVYRVPLLIVPPWINKYYILDLQEKNSFIRYLVAQGHTVFCISWVNPDARHAKIDFEDYMSEGTLAAMREIGRITGEDKVNVLGYCIGGTLLAMMLAWLKAAAPRPDLPKVASATYLVTLVDFAEPGDLGVFIDEEQIKALEARMARQGYIDGASLATTFNLLRSNDLIWSFVISKYLLGKEPFPFDILYWNADATNLPATMHSFYLRKMYLENKLVEPGGITAKGLPIDVRAIDTPAFLLSTLDDHIAPWRSTYAATQLYGGPVKFVLSGSGHIAGIVNPPDSGKYCYWTNDQCPPKPEDWFKGAAQNSGSWWPAWLDWLKTYAGKQVPAREVGAGLEDAPGSYVKARAV